MEQKRPNILIFMTDQQRGDTVPPFCNAKTPNLDKFFKESVAFTNAYCPSPHCCPSRAAFFSGLYPSQHGVWNNVDVGNTLSKGLIEGVRLWSEDLMEAGYKLYFSGKWHVSSEEGPQDRGWNVLYDYHQDYKYSAGKGRRTAPDTYEWGYYMDPDADSEYSGSIAEAAGNTSKRLEGEIIRHGYPRYLQYSFNETPFRDHEVTAKASEGIRNIPKDGKPWCCFVGTLGPHDPYFVPERFLKMYDMEKNIELPESFYDDMTDKPAMYRRIKDRYSQLTPEEHKKSIAHYLAFCTYEDYLFGEVMKALEESGDLNDTVVIYISDHGDYMGEHGLWAKGLPCFKSAYHIPALIRWPSGAVNPGRTVDAFISLADFAPTILDLAGCTPDRKLSGRSLIPFLKDKQPENWPDAVYTQTNGNELYGIQRSVMTDDWKYVYNGFDYDELYNLKKDPCEMRNLAADPACSEIIKELCRKMWQFAYEHGDVCINPYIMVAHAPFGPGIIFSREKE